MLLSGTETGAKAGADAAANAAIPERIQTDRCPQGVRSKNHVGPSSRTGVSARQHEAKERAWAARAPQEILP